MIMFVYVQYSSLAPGSMSFTMGMMTWKPWLGSGAGPGSKPAMSVTAAPASPDAFRGATAPAAAGGRRCQEHETDEPSHVNLLERGGSLLSFPDRRESQARPVSPA